MKRATTLGFGLCALVTVCSTPGRAEPSSAEKAMATQLYDDAEKLMEGKDYAGACPKYAESQRLDPQLGVLLHLADCFEKAGKTASAWASFKDAIEVSARKNAAGISEPREKIARDRAAVLEAKLSKIAINVTAPDLAGLEVTQDGQVVGRAMWGSAVPVDPGSHTVSAKAPGNRTWTKTVAVGRDGARVAVVVPSLELEPVAPAPAVPVAGPAPEALAIGGAVTPAGAETAPKLSSQRTVAYVVGGVGAAGLVVGAVFGVMRGSAISERDGICPTNRCTRDESNRIDDLTNKAKSDAMISNIAFGVGAAALVGGAVLFFTAPRSQPAKAATGIQPWGGPGSAGLAVRGEW